MSNPNQMINDPYAVEMQVQQLMGDRAKWMIGQKYPECNRDEFNKKMKNEYTYLLNASPVLFEKILSGFMDDQGNYNMMMRMLSLSKDIYDGKKKQEDVDRGLGQVLANKYVKPVVDGLDKNGKK
jgi:hypothetical protein